MDGNNWRANSGQSHVPDPVTGGEAPAAPGMAAGDWRTQLSADSRQRIVNKIMDTLTRHLPSSGQEGQQQLKKIAIRFEEITYASSTSQSDYLRKITSKMLTMETNSQNSMAISLQSNAPSNSKNPQDLASQRMQSQVPNQGQPLPIPMVTNQSQVRQQLLSQNIQNNIPSTGVPNSASLTSVLPTVGGVSQATMPNVVGQNPNMQNLQNTSSVTPNVVENSMGQGVPSNMFANTQRSNQGRQQSVLPQEQQQQSQNSLQYLYNQQLQQHIMKQKFQQGNISQSLVQSQIQQQNLLQPTQIQSSQQAVMQPSLRQSATSSSLLQNQQSSIQLSTQSMLQQQPQSVLRQQPQPQPQQSSLTHQQQTSMPQHPILPTQQQQQLSGHHPNATGMQQNQLIGQQNNILDAQHQQQQQRMMNQQHNHSNLKRQQIMGQQNLPNIHQQQSIAQQNIIPNMHQQQLGPQTNVQQQMVGIQSGNSGLQNNQHSVHMLQPSKVAVQQQMQQNVGNLLPNQAQQSQSQPSQQQMMSQIQSQPGQLQQQLGLQQQTNSLQRDVHQRIQTSGPLLQQHGALDQQKHLVHSQRAIPEATLSSLDCSSQTGNANGGDWQEEIFQKIRSMNDLYFPELNEMYQRMAAKLQQHDHPLPQQPKNEQLEKLRFFKLMLERIIQFLRTPRNDVQHTHKEKIVGVEKQIINILNSNKPRKTVSSVQQGHLSQPHLHTLQQSQQPQSQMLPHENQMNSQIQTENGQGSMDATQHNNITNLQSQGNAPNSLQQVAIGSLQQNPVSGPQQVHMNSTSSHSGLTTTQSNLNPLQPNSNVLPTQHVKQEQQMFPTTQQQIKQQIQKRQILEQYMQRQQFIQQQQQQQLSAHQMLRLQQISETNEMKMRQQMGLKSGVLQQHHSSGQRSSYHQPLKPGTPFSISSPQVLQAASPQANHALEEELQEINERLIDTVVYISDEDTDPTAVAATAKGGDGTIVKCSFSDVALSPNLKSPYASAQMSPIQSLRVLVPNNYPNCSSILLDKFPVEVRYDQAAGDPSYPIPPGLPFDKLPEDRRCPTFGASKSFFESKSVEIAGFAQNQQFGLGGNALTSGQKAVLIWGGLFLGFLFFLSGYFLH